MHWRRKRQPTPVFLPGESQGQGSLVGCCLWVTQSRTQLKWLSSSSRDKLGVRINIYTLLYKINKDLLYNTGSSTRYLLTTKNGKESEKNCITCREPVWGTPPVAKVVRKEAWHMQWRDRASGVPLEILEHLPSKPESVYFTSLCSHLHLWLYWVLSWAWQECWEAWDVLNCLNTDSFEQLKDWLEIVLVKGFSLLGQCLLLSFHIPYLLCSWQCID